MNVRHDTAPSPLWALPALLCLAVVLAWAVDGGGYAPAAWYPGGLVVAAILAGLGVSRARLPVGSTRVLVALGLLVAYALVNVLSIAWAEVRGDAWEGGNRALVVTAIFATFALSRWSPGSAALVLGGAAVGLTAVGLLVVAAASSSADPTSFFVTRRFAEPTGYPNATAALYLTPMFGALVLASRRELPSWARATLLGSAGALLGLGLMPQSRASVAALLVTLGLATAVATARLRLLLAAVVVACAVVPFAATLWAVDLYDEPAGEAVTSLLRDARTALVLIFAVLFLAGLAWAWADTRRVVPPRVVHVLGRIVGLGAVVAVGVAIVGALAFADGTARIGDAWEEFTAGTDAQPTASTSHLRDPLAGGNRHDLWRVALGQFEDAPFLGAGSDNFEADYVRERRSIDEPRHPHGLPFRALGQTGLVGTALLLAFVAVAGALAVAAARRRAAPEAAGVALAGLAAFTYWFVHGSVDWLWEFPALTGLALASLAIALTVDLPPTSDVVRKWGRLVPAVAVVVGAVAVAGTLLFPWLAQRETTRAADGWRRDPDAALGALEEARGLNPLSARPDIFAGVIAGRSGRPDRARAAFRNALARNPMSWYSLLELAVLDYEQGRTAAALRWIRRARLLNPKDQILLEARRAMRADERFTLRDLDGLVSRQLARLRGDSAG